MLENVTNFIQKIESKKKKKNLNLFNEFFELSPADYAKELINTKNPDENEKLVTEAENKISDFKNKIKK